jgi:hypothetical protein
LLALALAPLLLLLLPPTTKEIPKEAEEVAAVVGRVAVAVVV